MFHRSLSAIALLALALAPPVGAEEDETAKAPLFRQIGTDFRDVFTTRENLWIAAAGAGAALAVSPFDEEIATSDLNSELSGDATLDATFEAGEILGGAAVQIGGAVATYGLGRIFGNESVASLGRDLVRAQVVTQTLTFGVKLAASRERPDGSNDKSFPSGHASGAFATATVLSRRYGWKVGAPAYAFAGYVAASRLNESKHYLSDVVFGAAVGILVGRTVTLDVAGARFAVAPILGPRATGVQLTWVGGL
jgi:membrane-associated phospholipid phosphatase